MKTTTAYIFDNNFYFNGTCLVQADPKSEEWLIPSDCTLVKPELKAGYFYKFNEDENEWQAEKMPENCEECLGIEIEHNDLTPRAIELREIFKVLTDKDDNYVLHYDSSLTLSVVKKEIKHKTLDELREQKLNELSSKASRFEQTENKDMFITSSLGFIVNADPKAKRNIDTLIELQVQTFRDYDNVTHTDITVQDLEIIKREISLNAVNLYKQKWDFEDRVNNADSIEELEKIDIDFKMLDFSAVANAVDEAEVSDEIFS